MKKHNILKVVLISILVVVLCTWLFPSASFNTALVEGERMQVGLFDLFSYPLVALSYFGYSFIYVLLIGAFYGVLSKIPAYKELLNKIVKGFKSREWLFLVITMVVITAITSVTGLSFGLLVIFPITISLVLMMGYNKLVAASVTVGSVIAGLIGTTLGSSSVSYLNYLLNTKITDGMVPKIIVLVVALGLLVFNVLMYAKKTKNNDVQESSLIPSNVEVQKGKKIRIWPLALVFDLTIIILMLGVIDWESVFGLEIFESATSAVTEFSIGGFPIFGKILGSINPFGHWSFNVELPVILLLSTIVIGLIYRVKTSDFIENIISGMKKAVYPAAVVLLVFMLLIISTYHPFQLVIVKALLGLTNGLNVVTMTVISFLSSFFSVESVYTAQSTIPYITSVITKTELYPLIGLIFQSIYGLAMLILPSSAILMATLSYMDIPYGQWLKHIWKLFLEVLVVLLIIFIILLAIV